MEIIRLQPYPVYITGNFNAQDEFITIINSGNYSSVFILVDENTANYCLPKIRELLEVQDDHVLRIQSGEVHKNIETCKHLWSDLISQYSDRKSLLINLGGGVIGDMGGFVASTFKRGFNFMNIPTTLLSQVDASVGGKLGIDFNGGKNLIGVFNNPKAIFISTEFLNTLPFEQMRSGFAEVIKHGLIADKNYWNSVKNINLIDPIEWGDIIKTSVNIKKSVVETDMYEIGLRKILNFGHTIGHAVETLSLNNDEKPLLHGEAIAIGIICEAWLSNKLSGLTDKELYEITHVVSTYFPKYQLTNINMEDIYKLMQTDKKNYRSEIKFSLLSEIGKCTFDDGANRNLIEESLKYYQNL